MKLMVKGIPGVWEVTDKFEFTGLWRCGQIYDYRETDVEFEIRTKFNFIYRWWKGIPKTHWAEDGHFKEVNECLKPNESKQLFEDFTSL